MVVRSVTISGAIARPRGLLAPAVMLIAALICAVLAPVACMVVLMFVGLLVGGLRYPVITACIVLIAIPLVDQAVAESESANLFGAFRVTPAVVLKGMMALVVVSHLLRRRINPLRYRVLRPLLAWLGYTMITCVLFHDRAMALSMWMRLAYWGIYFVFFFVVATEAPATADLANRQSPAVKHVTLLWRAGLVATALFAGSVFLAKAMGVGGEFYGVGESYGFYRDPWNMALVLPGGMTLALLYPWVSGDKRVSVKRACGALATATVLASYLTFTRTSLIACLAGISIFAFSLKRIVVSKQTRMMFAFAVVVIAGVAVFVMRNVASTASTNQVAARWSEMDKGSVGSGRLEVFYAAWSKFMSASSARKLIGHGIGAGPEAAEEFTGVYVFLHDDLLEMLVCAGLIGVALYCWLFGRLYREVLAGFRRKDVWAVAALTSLVVYNLTAISYMRIYAVTPNTYFALAAGTSLGMLNRHSRGTQSRNPQ